MFNFTHMHKIHKDFPFVYKWYMANFKDHNADFRDEVALSPNQFRKMYKQVSDLIRSLLEHGCDVKS
jgi:hypothetical protein